MTILEVNNLTKAFGTDTILEGLSFKINQGERVRLIGENGSGKSTLLKMIDGIEEVTGGTITRPKGLRVGYLAQQLTCREGNTVYEEILDVFAAVRKLRADLEDLEAEMGRSEIASDEDRLQRTMARYGRHVEAFERMGGYTYEQRIEAALEGLGISAMRDRRIGSLSGGEKNVVALARMLLEEPDLLLLDEPGNHLDFEGLAWLEGFIRNYGKTAILVSHDRYLLDRTVERIVELEDRVQGYPGTGRLGESGLEDRSEDEDRVLRPGTRDPEPGAFDSGGGAPGEGPDQGPGLHRAVQISLPLGGHGPEGEDPERRREEPSATGQADGVRRQSPAFG